MQYTVIYSVKSKVRIVQVMELKAMYLEKSYIFKPVLIVLLSLLLGYIATFLSPAVNVSKYNISLIILLSFIAITMLIVLFFLKWEQLLFLFALSIGFQLYDPSLYEIMFCILIISLLIKQVPLNRNMFNNVLFFMLILFILFGTFSIFFSANFFKAAFWHIITVYLVLSGLFLILTIQNGKQLGLFLKGYVVGAVANSILGLVSYFGGDNQGGRLTGFFQDPNIFSPYIIIAILIVIEDSLSPKLFKSKQFKFFSLFLMIGAVVLAMSRAGWINLAAALTLYCALKVFKRQLKPSFVIKSALVTVASLISISFFFPTLTEILRNQLEERTTLQYYDNERFGAQSFTLKIAEDNLFGIGPGEITTIYYMDPHNTYFRVFAEQGWLSGISLMLLLLIIGFILLKRTLTLQRSEFNIYLVLLCGLAGTMINITVVDALHWRHFWILFALSYYVIIFKKEQAPS